MSKHTNERKQGRSKIERGCNTLYMDWGDKKGTGEGYLGCAIGCIVGRLEGSTEGMVVGCLLGSVVGLREGCCVG